MPSTPRLAAAAALRLARLALAACMMVAGCGARTGATLRSSSELEVDAVVPSIDAGADAAIADAFPPIDVGLDAFAIDAGMDAFAIDAGMDAFAIDAGTDAFAMDAGDPCAVGTSPLDGPICMRALHAEPPVLSCPGGFVDVVARGDGVLRWECDGRRAEAVFSDRTYRGTRTGESFSLCIQTEFDYLDGCHWQSSQRIEGALSDRQLHLSYREQATRGTGCFPPCTADATIDVL